jgi:8-amino-7-oxononanoate synthase
MELDQYYLNELEQLAAKGNLRRLPQAIYKGKWVEKEGQCLLNLSSNDYLGLASDTRLREEFMETLSERDFLFSASSSRLLTGNFPVYAELEELLADLYQAEGALVLDSGYHMNVGILPAVTDAQTLILADKLVHASLIDGIRLSAARCIRYRHQDYGQLESLVEKYQVEYPRMVIVTESVFSMDGDVTDLLRLVALKRRYPQVMLYVDEAHAVGVRGTNGLGVAEEQGCIADIDFLCGTFGKALASVGAFVICRKLLRDYLVNKMRTLIFTTALPPLNIAWTRFVVAHLPQWQERRKHLQHLRRDDKRRHQVNQSAERPYPDTFLHKTALHPCHVYRTLHFNHPDGTQYPHLLYLRPGSSRSQFLFQLRLDALHLSLPV